jgi:hypothetical protein
LFTPKSAEQIIEENPELAGYSQEAIAAQIKAAEKEAIKLIFSKRTHLDTVYDDVLTCLIHCLSPPLQDQIHREAKLHILETGQRRWHIVYAKFNVDHGISKKEDTDFMLKQLEAIDINECGLTALVEAHNRHYDLASRVHKSDASGTLMFNRRGEPVYLPFEADALRRTLYNQITGYSRCDNLVGKIREEGIEMFEYLDLLSKLKKMGGTEDKENQYGGKKRAAEAAKPQVSAASASASAAIPSHTPYAQPCNSNAPECLNCKGNHYVKFCTSLIELFKVELISIFLKKFFMFI